LFLVLLLPPHLAMPCVASTCCIDLLPHCCFVTLPRHCIMLPCHCFNIALRYFITASMLPCTLPCHCFIVALCVASSLPHLPYFTLHHVAIICCFATIIHYLIILLHRNFF
jgi:hypothetical protein